MVWVMEKYFKIVKYEDEKYIFNILTFVCQKLENEQSLEDYEKGLIGYEDLGDSDRRLLAEGYYVLSNKLKVKEELGGFDLVSFSFPPIHNCNLHCEYCFANHGDNYIGDDREFSEKMVEDVCHFIIENYQETSQFRLDFVSGGEPLLDAGQTIHFIELAKRIFEEKEKKLFVWLCTNGTTITLQDAKKLDQLDVRLGVSIDGKKQAHDAVRKFANGKGSYDEIINNIEPLFGSKELSKSFKNIWALCTITSQNHDFIGILKHLKEIGFTGVQMKFIRGPKDNFLSLNAENIAEYEKDIEAYFAYFYERCMQDDFQEIMLILNDTDFVGKIMKRFFLNMPLANRCYAARSQCSITAKGDVFPCASFVGDEKYSIGNIYTGFDQEKRSQFWGRTVDQNDECKKCWVRYLCTGQCFSNCLFANGDIGKPEYLYCRIEKKVIMETINFAEKLSLEVRNNLVRMVKLKNLT